MRPAAGIAALILLLGAPGGSTPATAAFVADLSERLIAITTGFTGTSVLLFGAAEQPGSDITVTVRGPPGEVVVRRKERLGPIWIDGAEVRFAAAPSYYAAASSRPLDEVSDQTALADHQVGLERLVLPASSGDAEAAADRVSFRDALFRAKRRQGLYRGQTGKVSFVGERLFRTTVEFPANVPPGTYAVEVLQFTGGRLSQVQRNELQVTKIGLEARVSAMATAQGLLYGMASITLAVAAGWIAAIAFRRP